MSFSDELLEDDPESDELTFEDMFGPDAGDGDLTLDQLVRDYIDEVLEGDYG